MLHRRAPAFGGCCWVVRGYDTVWDSDRPPVDTQRPHRSRGFDLWLERSCRDPTPSLTRVAADGLVAAAGRAVFGVPPLSLHSPTRFVGTVDPLCGMTRGIGATLRTDLRAAWWYNPASPLVVVAGMGVVARWVMGR